MVRHRRLVKRTIVDYNNKSEYRLRLHSSTSSNSINSGYKYNLLAGETGLFVVGLLLMFGLNISINIIGKLEEWSESCSELADFGTI